MSTMTIDGMKMYYEKSGEKGRPVILLHGWDRIRR